MAWLRRRPDDSTVTRQGHTHRLQLLYYKLNVAMSSYRQHAARSVHKNISSSGSAWLRRHRAGYSYCAMCNVKARATLARNQRRKPFILLIFHTSRTAWFYAGDKADNTVSYLHDALPRIGRDFYTQRDRREHKVALWQPGQQPPLTLLINIHDLRLQATVVPRLMNTPNQSAA